MDVLILVFRGTVAWLLLSAAFQKWRDGSKLENMLTARFGWGPRRSVRARQGLIVSESLIGFGLLIPLAWPYFVAGAGALFSVFAVVVAIWQLAGNDGDCGCGGLMPMLEVSVTHIVALALLVAGSAAIAGHGMGGGSGIADAHPWMSALLMAMPLIVLLWIRAIRELLDNWAALRELDAVFYGRRS